jgi:hypothetical protein
MARFLAVLLLLTMAACDSTDSTEPEPVRPVWQELSLPVPAGAAGRLAPRDATTCGDRWYVVGAVIAPDGASRPAAWSSRDGRTWTSMTFNPRTFYGEQAILYTAACRGDQFAVVGAKSGGAHGNPRITQWYLRPDGVLDEVLAAFTQYGGEAAGSVKRISVGPAGWMITGSRASGAAVWLSPDATEFELIEKAPQLASDTAARTSASDALARPEGWLVVGGVQREGRIDRDPAAWTSVDGRTWSRIEVPGTEGYDDLQRVVSWNGQVVAVGLAGPAFSAWRAASGTWQPAGRFGSTGSSGTATVHSVAVAGRVFVTATDGSAQGLWSSADGGTTWQTVVLPAPAPAGSDRIAAVAGSDEQLILVVDDGLTGRLWSTKVAPG